MSRVDNYALTVYRLAEDTDDLILKLNQKLTGGEFNKAKTSNRKNLEIEVYFAALNYEPLDVIKELKNISWGPDSHVVLTYRYQHDGKLTTITIADSCA